MNFTYDNLTKTPISSNSSRKNRTLSACPHPPHHISQTTYRLPVTNEDANTPFFPQLPLEIHRSSTDVPSDSLNISGLSIDTTVVATASPPRERKRNFMDYQSYGSNHTMNNSNDQITKAPRLQPRPRPSVHNISATSIEISLSKEEEDDTDFFFKPPTSSFATTATHDVFAASSATSNALLCANKPLTLLNGTVANDREGVGILQSPPSTPSPSCGRTTLLAAMYQSSRRTRATK